MIKDTHRKIVPLVQYILFAMLVMATPFVVVTKFLQGAVNNVSHMMWYPFGIKLPIVGSLAIAMLALFIIWQRKNLTLRRVFGALVVVVMILFAQWVQDLYSNMTIYDLQKNWHYIAYAAYVYIFFAAFHVRGMSVSKMILASFFSAIALSSIDELFQFHLSHRVFDISDIAKDAWGAAMGLVMVLFVSETYTSIDLRKYSIWQKKLSDYWRNPIAAIIVISFFSLILIVISPLLTEYEYLWRCVLVSVAIFIVVMALYHFSRFRAFRIGLLSVIAALMLLLGGNIFLHRNDNITHVSRKLIVYKGIPIPYFDLLIYPNGLPRLTDKKKHFNLQDQRFLKGCEPDILLIGSGYEGEGGKGFKNDEGTFFIYNTKISAAVQVVVTKTHVACKMFNKLKKDGKKVLFVVHNS